MHTYAVTFSNSLKSPSVLMSVTKRSRKWLNICYNTDQTQLGLETHAHTGVFLKKKQQNFHKEINK